MKRYGTLEAGGMAAVVGRHAPERPDNRHGSRRRLPCHPSPRHQFKNAFTLIELLVVISIISVLMCLVVPSLATARHIARKTVCKNNLRTLQFAYMLYLEDNRGKFFPKQELMPDGSDLWYWGLELPSSGLEGSRKLDATKARLYPYFPKIDKLKVCPSIPYEQSYFKAKFELAGYGYGINSDMLADRNDNIDEVTHPAATVAWADCAQINNFQPPGSKSHPLLEEWYYLTNEEKYPTFHFRHLLSCNASYADGTIHELRPYGLKPETDGLVGHPEPTNSGSSDLRIQACDRQGITQLLRIRK